MNQKDTWRLRFTVMVVVITTLPYLMAYFLQGQNFTFSGFVFGVEDGNSYLAKMMTGTAGAWLFRTSFTTFPQTGVFAYFPYLLLGKLAGAPGIHDQLVFLFQLFRIAGVVVYIKAVYDFMRFFIPANQTLQKFGVWIVILGGGFGFLYLLAGASLWNGRIPLEFYSPETFGFLMVYGLPHLAFARALFLWGIVNYINPKKPAYLAGLCWLAVGIFQPLTTAIAWLLVAGFMIGLTIWNYVKRNNHLPLEMNWFLWVKRSMQAGAVSAPIVLYNFSMFVYEPFLRAWTQQNIISSPPPGDYLLAYGLVFIVLMISMRNIRFENHPGLLFLFCWVIILLPLAYFPHNLQRRLPEAGWVALITLALTGLAGSSKNIRRLGMATLGTGLLSTIFFVASTFFGVLQVGAPMYTPNEEKTVYNIIAQNSNINDVVLAPYRNSNEIPAWAPVRVVLGHGPESVEANQLKEEIAKIYNLYATEADWQKFVTDHHVNYILWPASTGEMPYSGNWIYSNSAFSIFRVAINP